MSDSNARVAVKGTVKPELAKKRSPRADERGIVDVYLRRASPLAEITSYGRTRPFLTRADFARAHGARVDDAAAVRAFAESHGLAVGEIDLAARRAQLAGSWHALGEAFGTAIDVVEIDGDEVFRNRDEISVPASIAPVVQSILGLDTTPVARRHGTFSSGTHSLTVAEVATRYGFPTTTPTGATCDGTGETVALLQFEATFDANAFDAFFQARGLAVPTVVVRIDRGSTPLGHANDGEALGDALIAGQAAPGARIVEWLHREFTSRTVAHAISKAVHDTTDPATVLSMSYGWFGWSAAEVATIDAAFQDAAALGVTCINSSGDSGSGQGPGKWNGPQSPADCPNVLAVGGTVIESHGGEVVWNNQAIGLASTGGYSGTFTAPFWQSGVIPSGQTMRGVPDVSAHADSYEGALGTSVAAPMWAGLIARINQVRLARSLARLGLVAPELYANRRRFRDIVVGDNGVGTIAGTSATAGWDAATGLGVPTAALVHVLVGEWQNLPKLLDHKRWKPEIDIKASAEIVPQGDPPEWIRTLQIMAEGLDHLSREVQELRAFIRPEQRPQVGDDVIARAAAERLKPGT